MNISHGADGAPLGKLELPDGHRGHPRAGLALFETRAGCAGCHPAPLFTTDQDPATRGRFLDVGTPRLLPLRPQQQELHFAGVGPPASRSLTAARSRSGRGFRCAPSSSGGTRWVTVTQRTSRQPS